MGAIPALESQYQYGQYGQGGKVPFGSLTISTPRVNPTTTIEPTTGISIPTQHSYVNDENGNKISLGQDGVGLAHRDAKDYGFMMVA